MKAYKGKLGLTPISQELAKATPGERPLQHTVSLGGICSPALLSSLVVVAAVSVDADWCRWVLTGGAQV